MKTPKGANRWSWENRPMYQEGWFAAKEDWNDMIPYSDDTRNEALVAPEAEDWDQGYFDFWTKMGFEL